MTLIMPMPSVMNQDCISPFNEGIRCGCNLAEGGIFTIPFTSSLANSEGVCPFNSQWNAESGKNDQHSTPASAKSVTQLDGTGYS